MAFLRSFKEPRSLFSFRVFEMGVVENMDNMGVSMRVTLRGSLGGDCRTSRCPIETWEPICSQRADKLAVWVLFYIIGGCFGTCCHSVGTEKARVGIVGRGMSP